MRKAIWKQDREAGKKRTTESRSVAEPQSPQSKPPDPRLGVHLCQSILHTCKPSLLLETGAAAGTRFSSSSNRRQLDHNPYVLTSGPELIPQPQRVTGQPWPLTPGADVGTFFCRHQLKSQWGHNLQI